MIPSAFTINSPTRMEIYVADVPGLNESQNRVLKAGAAFHGSLFIVLGTEKGNTRAVECGKSRDIVDCGEMLKQRSDGGGVGIPPQHKAGGHGSIANWTDLAGALPPPVPAVVLACIHRKHLTAEAGRQSLLPVQQTAQPSQKHGAE